MLTAAFDVDGTLLDPEMRAYTTTVSDLLASIDLGLTADKAFSKYETIRSQNNALERIGLRNASHERGNPDALALMCLLHCNSEELERELSIASDESYLPLLSQLAALDHAARSGSFESRLEAEVRVRTFCATEPRLPRLLTDVQRIARHPKITGWSMHYRELELAQPVENHLPMLQVLGSRDVAPIVISEGRASIQLEKLDRLGLTDFFEGKILITETAGQVPGTSELDEAITRLIEARVRSHAAQGDDALPVLWHWRCLLDTWAGKTPWFFARCLHAIQSNTARPSANFDVPTFVPPEEWQHEPLRFVMVGDRYDKDVEPLIDLLGPSVGMKIRLRTGKYAHLHPEDELPVDRRPDRTFTDWDSLARFLTEELNPDMVPPITAPPDIVDRAQVRPDTIERGLDSQYEAVRTIASIVATMMDSARRTARTK